MLSKPLPTYPHGFPPEVIEEFERRIGRGTLGNFPASGTEIIKQLGVEHLRTGKPIVYTSADSVFQIATNEQVIPIDQLYWMCEQAREMLTGEHAVGRVIARPFIGSDPTNFTRTERRRDYPLIPPTQTMLQKVVEAGLEVCSVGKIDDIFAHTGITQSKHTTNNADSLAATLEFLEDDFKGLLFVNLIEFDMLYGHRNDPAGYATALQKVDQAVPEMIKRMKEGDIAMFVADHGVDPTTPSTDHSREFAPLLVFGTPVRPGTNLGTRGTFSDVGATIAECLLPGAPTIWRKLPTRDGKQEIGLKRRLPGMPATRLPGLLLSAIAGGLHSTGFRRRSCRHLPYPRDGRQTSPARW